MADEKRAPVQRTKHNPNNAETAAQIQQAYDRLTKIDIRQVRRFRYMPLFANHLTKEDIIKYLSNPQHFERELRRAVRYIYFVSPHFHRLIQYFAGLSDLSYVVSPYKIDPAKASPDAVAKNYRKVLNVLSAMKVSSQFRKILTVCLREDVFYGLLRASSDDIAIQQLPSDFCRITSVEGGVPNVTFDFRYFDHFPENLENYPQEFHTKYEQYRRFVVTESKRRLTIVDDNEPWWIELDSPNAFAVKCNAEPLDCAIPPFAGVLPEVFDIESYKELKMAKTELENYAMLAMRIPLNDDGSWGIDLNKAEAFWGNLDSVLPDRVGSVLTPMDIDKIDFDRSDNADDDTLTEAEQSLFTAAGVSSLLFNNDRA